MSALADISPLPRIAIIGGGFTGAAVAWNLVAAIGTGQAAITLFEPRERLGAGLAYDTDEPAHRINVPASRMSLDPASPDSFEVWIKATGACNDDPGVQASDGHLYPRRQVFGAYVADALVPALARGQVVHNRAAIRAISRGRTGFILTDGEGHLHRADLVVIATSHPAPVPPRAIAAALSGHPRFVADATRPGALAAIRPDDRVLVIGNGLTAADVIATLAGTGHRGPVDAISRRGLVSRGHAARTQDPWGDFVTRPSRSASELVRRIRLAIDDAAIFDISWHAVIDAVRAQGQQIWQALPLSECRRIVRHIRPFWDVHRFRIAPQIEAILEAARQSGRLHHHAGRITDAAIDGETIRVDLVPRSGGPVQRLIADAVVVTTGPAHGSITETAPHLASLARAGLLGTDPTGLGIACDSHATVLDADGRPVEGLFVAGPLARGTFGELMGLPQVADHARLVGAELVGHLKRIVAARAEQAAA